MGESGFSVKLCHARLTEPLERRVKSDAAQTDHNADTIEELNLLVKVAAAIRELTGKRLVRRRGAPYSSGDIAIDEL
jgi:hypothetical protein